ncbi:hypothetical protein EVAR_94122_1 [Eumeta japonica]|uniref:Craniofacial development protein 2 n=1 Tax=Eumeta variegata TaxID=151549 RepID=A0A4C1U6R5_EUMVA|nr:hypothetical protein EVAR_94122_1 [Eumeta japonica]
MTRGAGGVLDVMEILMKCNRNERIVILGDFNGWVGVQLDGYEKVLVKFGDERVNENGDYLLLLCQEFNLNDDGHLLNEENNVKERWKNYFVSVYTCEDTVADNNIIATEYMIDVENEGEIRMDKIMKALKHIKVGKPVGYDRVLSVMLRGGQGLQCLSQNGLTSAEVSNRDVQFHPGHSTYSWIAVCMILKDYECGLRIDELSVKYLYADNQVILAPLACQLQEMVNKINDSVKKMGMKVSVGEKFEQGKSLYTWVVCLQMMVKHDRDIERRVNTENKVNGALFAIMNSKSMLRQARLAMCMGMSMAEEKRSRINAVEMRSLGSMCGVSRKDRCSNSNFRERYGLKEDVVPRVERGTL